MNKFINLYFLSWSLSALSSVYLCENGTNTPRHNLLSSVPANGQRVHCQLVDLGYYIYWLYIPHPYCITPMQIYNTHAGKRYTVFGFCYFHFVWSNIFTIGGKKFAELDSLQCATLCEKEFSRTCENPLTQSSLDLLEAVLVSTDGVGTF